MGRRYPYCGLATKSVTVPVGKKLWWWAPFEKTFRLGVRGYSDPGVINRGRAQRIEPGVGVLKRLALGVLLADELLEARGELGDTLAELGYGLVKVLYNWFAVPEEGREQICQRLRLREVGLSRTGFLS